MRSERLFRTGSDRKANTRTPPKSPCRWRPQVEALEDRRLLSVVGFGGSPLHFDFGTAGSPVAPGYIGVPVEVYSAARGYGWQSITGISAVDRGTANPLTRDLHLGNSGTFLVDLANGAYDVTATLGDPSARHNTVALWAQGQEVASGMTTRAGEFLEPTFRVTVTNGRLSLKIADLGGTGATFAICGLDITPARTSGPLTALYVSTQGNDTNDGETLATAFRTIHAAAAHASYGITICVEAGTYYEQLVSKVDGAAGKPIVFTSDAGVAVIDGSKLGWTAGSNQNQGVAELRNSYNQLVGLKIVNSPNTGVVLGANHLVVADCDISETQRHGISTDTRYQPKAPGTGVLLSDITLKNNDVYDNVLMGKGYGQAVSLIADGFTVSGNSVHNSMVEGIDIWLGAKHGEVVGNKVFDNGKAGIYVDGAHYVRIDGNEVDGNYSGIGVSSENPNYTTTFIWVYNNLVYNNTTTGLFMWDSSTAPGYHGEQDVLLMNNTLVNNPTAIYLAGDSNTATIMNNLAYASLHDIYNSSTNSIYDTHNNVWLTSLAGFVSPSTNDYDLTSRSPAINKGYSLPRLKDDLGNIYYVTTDFLGRNRVVGNYPDAGAFEYQL